MLSSFPVLLPFFSGICLLLLQDSSRLRRQVALGSLLLQVGLAVAFILTTYAEGRQVAYLGSWMEPIGIILVGDKAASLLVLLAVLVTLAATLTGFSEEKAAEEHPLRQSLVQFLLTGIQLSFLTGDLFNLFVAFEVMLLSSYGLMTLEGKKGHLRHAYPYVVINLLGSALFLAGCGYAYALFGTLNFAGMAEAAASLAQTPEGDARITILTALLALVFSIKAGMFPLYYWLPKSYPILPASLGALYSGLLTKVGIYVLLRLLGTVMPPTQDELYLLIAWLGGGTMFFGVLGAVSRMGVREILAFHVLSQVGFMILAIGFFTEFAFAATLFYMLHHIIVKSGLFVAGSGILRLNGTDHLKYTGGLWTSKPLFGVAFLLLAFSLAGLPPLSGFWAKLWILYEGISEGYYTLVAISLVASVLTLASMLKIWFGAFWQPAPENSSLPTEQTSGRPLWIALGLMVAGSLTVILTVQPLWQASVAAAAELLDTPGYIESVLYPGDPK
jgi:multicomponent Na+:H+ antiporter subunit D